MIRLATLALILTALTAGATSQEMLMRAVWGKRGVVPAAAWNPSNSPSIFAWWDAQDSATISTNVVAGRVNRWDGKIGGWSGYQDTAGTRPYYVQSGIGGYPVIDFRNAQNLLVSNIVASTSWWAVAWVINFTNIAANSLQSVFDSQTGRLTANQRVADTNYAYTSGGNYSLAPNTIITGLQVVVMVITNGAGTISVNGTVLTNSLGASAVPLGGVTRIGSRYAGSSQFLSGGLGELLIFSNALSLANRQITEGYLAWRWGLQSSLPPTHPYYSARP